MKKTLLSILLLFALLLSMTACFDFESESKNPTGENPPPVTKTVYETLTELSAKQYDKVTLTVSVTAGDVTLDACYTVTESKVAYTVEQLNKLPTDGTWDGVSPDPIVTLSGTATVSNGKITHVDGDPVTLPEGELNGKFGFSEGNFKNVTAENGRFRAEVLSPAAFLGTKSDADDMTVDVTFTQTALRTVMLTYSTAQSSVITTYTFE